MSAEVNAEEIEDLALIKVGGGPSRSDAVQRSLVTGKPDDETDTLLQRHREHVIRDLKSRLGGIPVDSCNVFKESVPRLPDRLHSGDDIFAGDGNRQFITVELSIGSKLGERFNRGMVRVRLEDGLFALNRRGGVVH